MKNTLRIGIAIMLLCSKSFGQAFNNLPVLTQNLHYMENIGWQLQENLWRHGRSHDFSKGGNAIDAACAMLPPLVPCGMY
jgi:hypothetical protein